MPRSQRTIPLPSLALPAPLSSALLLELLACHATPGDEQEVRDLLERAWRGAGWKTLRLGDYAVAATPPVRARKPVLLVCAHMDSPGFAIDRLSVSSRKPKAQARCWGLTTLGGAALHGNAAEGVLKCAAGKLPVVIRKRGTDGKGQPDLVCELTARTPSPAPGGVRHGDRVCFAPQPRLRGHHIHAAFLDNRLGCWLLAALPALFASWRSRYNLVLGATACEEMGGFGASVLAHRVRPDLTIVLDATYVSPPQQVRMGRGPVLTITDASVLLSPARRDAVAAYLAEAGIPLQTEVYNYSGTDARAFPRQGLSGPVLPLLVPTTGNHSPSECADLRDVEALARAIQALAQGCLVRPVQEPPPGR
ncbi:MAG: hypothetical protein PHR35_06655 [Kiritimatiellae bacterium]|nr:hypothetical protein [Kiritimatiellia bacterium]